ncbi:MAG: Hsp20/alpha crystallin family protein [Candidatus Methanoperedens sp.]|nr:Hsp20/alpha crystallin family protein [Candidatus Methanoperedens sp.]
MKKRNGVEDFLKRLEEAFNSMLDEIDSSEKRPLFIDISINVCPFMFFNTEEAGVHGKTPVDIIETEKKVHVVIGLPGVDEETIRLACTGTSLEIAANNAEKTFKETIILPAQVNKTGMKATYEKGILEVVFNKSRKLRKSIT